MPAVNFMASSPPRTRVSLAVGALLVAAAVPWKEVAFAIAVLLLVTALPLRWQQIRLVLQRCWPIMTMLAIALLVTMLTSSGVDKRTVIRILFYYVRIPVFLLLGFAARRYVADDRPLLWTVVALGVWGGGQTVFRYLIGGSLSGLDHNEIRAVVGSGDTISMLIPLCMLTLWPRTQSALLKGLLVGASGVALLGVAASSSRTGILVLLLSGVFSLPRVRPLPIARWGSVAALVATFVLTTPALPPLLHALGLDPTHINSLAEVIARPRSDLQSINEQWRGYETYMAFVAAASDGFGLFFVGHGLEAFAPLGVLIELAPGQMFDHTDVFHNGWSFIVLHSGLLGVGLYIAQFFLFAAPPASSGSVVLRYDNRLFALLVLSLASSTAVVAGAFNAGTFASVQLFLIGCFYPYSLVPVRRLLDAGLPRRALSPQG